MIKNLLLHYLDVRQISLDRLPNGADLHSGLLADAPRFYRHLPADLAADISHRQEALVRLLGK